MALARRAAPVVVTTPAIITTLPTKPTMTARTVSDYICLFYGPPGVGKSTFVNQLAERVLFLSTDRGTRFMEAMRMEVNSWSDCEAIVSQMEKSNVDKMYDLVCIDHIDDVANFAEEEVCRRLNIESLGDAGYGKGWKAYRTAIQTLVNRLLRLKIGVVFIAHEDIKTIKGRSIETNRTMPMMLKGAWKVIVPMADIIGYCGYKTI